LQRQLDEMLAPFDADEVARRYPYLPAGFAPDQFVDAYIQRAWVIKALAALDTGEDLPPRPPPASLSAQPHDDALARRGPHPGRPAPPDASTVRAVWLADLHPDRIQPGPGLFVFVPGSRADDVTGVWCVEAAGPPGVLRVVSFAAGETDEGLDVAQPIVVEGELVVIRHPARGTFPAVVELQVPEARRVR
jgi:hypothetical protein